jgi:hypothetical protein
MAAQKVYVPFYTTGANGKKAYQFIELSGTLTNAKVPAEAPMIDSRAVQSTPPQDNQPPEA